MDEKELKQYCRRAKKHLFCGAEERAQFEQYIAQCARDFLEECPQATLEDLEAALDTPEQAAASFMETLPPDTVEQYRKKRRIRLGIMTGGVVLAFLLMVGVLVYVWKANNTIVITVETTIGYLEEGEPFPTARPLE